MGLQPLGDRIIVKRLSTESVSPGGIIVPEMAQEKSQRAVIVAAGRGLMQESGEFKPLEVKVGEIVMIGKYAGQEIKIDGEEHLLMPQNEVMAIFTEDKAPKED